MYRLLFKTITRTRKLSVPFCIFTSLFFIMPIYVYLTSSSPLDGMLISLILSYPMSIMFAFISYEFISDEKRVDAFETIIALRHSAFKVTLNKIAVLISIAVIHATIFFVEMIIIFTSSGVNPNEIFLYVLKTGLIDIFLTVNIGIAIGCLTSKVNKRGFAYFCILIWAILFGSLSNTFMGLFQEDLAQKLYNFLNIFNIYVPSVNWTVNYSFGYSVQNYRIQHLLFWLFAFCGLYLFSCGHQYKRKLFLVVSIFLLIISGYCFSLYRSPVSTVLLQDTYDEQSSAILSDARYYCKNMQHEEQATFSIESYDMFLDVGRTLSAKVKVLLSDNEKETDVYKFTLYHGYNVNSIKDSEGKNLDFKQSGDYIIVKCIDGLKDNILHFDYSGYSPRYYSNEQGICLPGFFPFYPRAGYYKVWDANDQSFTKTIDGKKANFDVKLQSKLKVFSNIGTKNKNEFSGSCDALTLVAGFLHSYVSDGIEVIYPFLDPVLSNESRISAEINKLLTDNPKAKKNIKKIICIPSMNQISDDERYCVFSNYMTATQIFMISDAFERISIPEIKKDLYHWVKLFEANPENIVESMYLSNNAALKKFYEFAINDGNFIAECYEYLENDYDLRKVETFLNEYQTIKDGVISD